MCLKGTRKKIALECFNEFNCGLFIFYHVEEIDTLRLIFYTLTSLDSAVIGKLPVKIGKIGRIILNGHNY